MSNFTLYDLSMLALAIERQKKAAKAEYEERVAALDRLSAKLQREVDAVQSAKSAELEERGFFDDLRETIKDCEEYEEDDYYA